MKEVLLVVIGCGVGIVLCIVYLVILLVKSINTKCGKKRVESFDFDENTLTIDLRKTKK